jgi:hypothetical protein
MWMNPNNKGYIRATTISSEKFIIIGSQNIELSGNVIMKNGATLSSGLLNTNSIVPNETNSVSLGTSSKIWSNAYIKDLSINNNIEISGNTRINGILQASNIYTKTEIDNSFSNVYTKNQVYSKSEIDASFLKIDASLANVYTKLSVIDSSLASVYTRGQVDLSFVSKELFDASINALAVSGGGSSIDLTSISGDIVPSTNNTFKLGTNNKNWANAYIHNLKVFNRVYQEISGGSNWNAVNGYYGLAKQSFPALNPLTSGAKAIAYWTARPTTGSFDFKNIVWSPKLKMFLTFSDGNWGGSGAKYSYDGINWINIFSGYALLWDVKALCWSDDLGIFVAGSYRHPFAIYSYNGIEWYSNTTRNTGIAFSSICWSPELGIFVAVGESTIIGTSTDGINWIGATSSEQFNKWGSVCWAPELGLFVATGIDYQNTNTKVITSNDGYNWTLRTVPTTAEYPSWVSVCWSPQLGIFVTVASNGGYSNANIMTSTNGIDWIIRGNNNNVSYRNVSWCAELGLFLITQTSGGGSYLYSRNGIDWIEIYENISETGEWSSFNAYSVVRSPELGIFVAVGGNKIWTSVLKGRPPTSYNVFDSSFNRIDENGKWDFSNIAVTTLNVTGTFTNTSDDRLKHNEVTIANGLDVIDKLNPKFYQKTLTMLDASYNGDLSAHSWSYEAGLIAQDLLQINDLSFVVSGGDYYRESYIYKRQTNDPSNTNYDPSGNNYDICYNLITQTYNVNYSSVFVYGLAAIKELHAKVKAQETTISSLISRIELLEQQKV